MQVILSMLMAALIGSDEMPKSNTVPQAAALRAGIPRPRERAHDLL